MRESELKYEIAKIIEGELIPFAFNEKDKYYATIDSYSKVCAVEKLFNLFEKQLKCNCECNCNTSSDKN